MAKSKLSGTLEDEFQVGVNGPKILKPGFDNQADIVGANAAKGVGLNFDSTTTIRKWTVPDCEIDFEQVWLATQMTLQSRLA